MKTPMQELIEDLSNNMVISIFERLEREGIFDKALEKEKEQIKEAWISGCKYLPFDNPEYYYTETFKL